MENLLTEKYNLVNSAEYKRIRELQLKNILKLSSGSTDPNLLKGMLKLIYDTDEWEREFTKEKNKNNKE